MTDAELALAILRRFVSGGDLMGSPNYVNTDTGRFDGGVLLTPAEVDLVERLRSAPA